MACVAALALLNVWKAPRFACVLALPWNNVPMFALTSLVFAIHKLPAIPAPPRTTNAPVVVLVEVVVALATRLLFVPEPNITLPSTYKLPAMPAPPATVNALLPIADVAGKVDCACKNPDTAQLAEIVPSFAFRLPPTPTPPVTTSAPVVLDVLDVPSVIFTLPPTLILPATPAPPLTTSAPVVVSVDVVVAAATKFAVVEPEPMLAPFTKYEATFALL